MKRLSKYKRILIKLSGEVLRGEKEYGIDPQTINSIAQQIKNVHSLDIEIAVVVGGGNIYRGVAASAAGMERTTADYMGMLATVINSLSLQDALEKIGLYVRVQSAINMPQVAEPYIQRRATRHLEKGRIVVFAAGTGNPYFTTDTAAALRAKEVNADVLLKATKVDHIFDSDPAINKEAKPIEEISHMDVIRKKLKIMDSTALSLCMDNNLPIIVFNINQADNLIKIVKGEKVGTTVA